MDKIQLLPDSVANQIAAGEVIQRPASVIKELVENAVDAGARHISVAVVDAGKSSIQVMDDGTGMSVTDARLAFERHATSKIRKADDLFSLTTMGFRGEALPSIASVAQVTLKTRQENDNIGTLLRIDGGALQMQEPVNCPAGCNFIVENLFYNVPVRRRFLKSNVTEMNNVIAAFQRIALVYPDIAFTLTSNGQEMMNLQPANTHKRIIDVFGKKLNAFLLPIEVETSLGKIYGFVGKPEAARKKNVQQYFFVNGRYMKHAGFHKAVMASYERLVKQGEQIPYFIYFEINPEDIDVNIHPTKTEIKFRDEASVWQILSVAVHEAVGKFTTIPSIDFDTEGRPDIPVVNGMEEIHIPTIDFNPQYNPFSSSPSARRDTEQDDARPRQDKSGQIRESAFTNHNRGAQSGWDELYSQASLNGDERAMPSLFDNDNFNDIADGETHGAQVARQDGTDEKADGTRHQTFAQPLVQEVMPRSNSHYQYKGTCIITSVASGLMVTHQERAHERILFERFMREMQQSKMPSQRLLFPEAVQFPLEQMLTLPSVLPEMEALGFELTNLGGSSYAINAVPAGLEGVNVAQLVSDMVASATECAADISRELHASLAATMARNAAIASGQVLSQDEMENIITDLLKCENCRYTPDGRMICYIIPDSDITRFF